MSSSGRCSCQRVVFAREPVPPGTGSPRARGPATHGSARTDCARAARMIWRRSTGSTPHDLGLRTGARGCARPALTDDAEAIRGRLPIRIRLRRVRKDVQNPPGTVVSRPVRAHREDPEHPHPRRRHERAVHHRERPLPGSVRPGDDDVPPRLPDPPGGAKPRVPIPVRRGRTARRRVPGGVRRARPVEADPP